MNTINYPSRLLENAVNELSKLPGVGKKTALRLALFLLKMDKEEVKNFSEGIWKFRSEIQYCKTCYNISDVEECDICANTNRNHQQICVVESVRDVMAIENTHSFSGIFHVLGGVISPMEGIGPNDLTFAPLEEKLAAGNVSELIFALSATMEGDTTNFYLYKKLSKYGVKITTIARGVSVGDELEYTDEVTLGRSITNRLPFESTI